MNLEMAYLLGMYYGNGQMQRRNTETTVSIEIPHKKLLTEDNTDVQVYVKASIEDIRNVLQPLLGTSLISVNTYNKTIISFTEKNEDYTMREFSRLVDRKSSCEFIKVTSDIKNFKKQEKIQFLKGFADVTGYVRRSNHASRKKKEDPNYEADISKKLRVYLEIPRNWELVIDICNLLKEIDIPIETINWAHPNMRDGNLKKYNKGLKKFWKKEHQIKIYVSEFEQVGFNIIHKQQTLEKFIKEQKEQFFREGKDIRKEYHKYYWEKSTRKKEKPSHPEESDEDIPGRIRGKHYNNWKEIAKELGYGE